MESSVMILPQLEELNERIKTAAREIYYARKHIRESEPENHDWAMTNLLAALHALGVRDPKDVGLSAIALGEKK
jgi:hypothetical protein